MAVSSQTVLTAKNEHELSPPHRGIKAANKPERFCLDLFDALWRRYRDRVVHVRTYARILQEAGATFVNDHIAFRTFACQNPSVGIASLARVFEALGYRGRYH